MDDADLVRAIEANAAELLMAMGAAGGGEQRESGGVRWTIGGSPLDYHNAVVEADLSAEAADMAIAESLALMKSHGVPGCWHVGPSMRPTDLGDRLLTAGFTYGGSEPGMAVDLAELIAPPNPRPDLPATPTQTPTPTDLAATPTPTPTDLAATPTPASTDLPATLVPTDFPATPAPTSQPASPSLVEPPRASPPHRDPEARRDAQPLGGPDSPRATPASIGDLRITRVVDDEGLAAWEATLGRGFGEGPKEARWVAEIYRREGYDDPWRHYLGWLDGEPVATTSIFLAAGVAGVYFVMTIPEARRRGIGAAITHAALREARDSGFAYGVLGSSSTGRSVYAGLGFREYCTINFYEWSPTS